MVFAVGYVESAYLLRFPIQPKNLLARPFTLVCSLLLTVLSLLLTVTTRKCVF